MIEIFLIFQPNAVVDCIFCNAKNPRLSMVHPLIWKGWEKNLQVKKISPVNFQGCFWGSGQQKTKEKLLALRKGSFLKMSTATFLSTTLTISRQNLSFSNETKILENSHLKTSPKNDVLEALEQKFQLVFDWWTWNNTSAVNHDKQFWGLYA